MKTKNPFLFGITKDAKGYIITKEDFNSFKRYNYISRTSLGERTAEIVINEALELIKTSPSAE
jgi:DNA-binding MarR family transcriptional regulator